MGLALFFTWLSARYQQWKASRRSANRGLTGATRAPHTECIDCGITTYPGVGSARCPECWQDRCGHYFVTGEEGSERESK